MNHTLSQSTDAATESAIEVQCGAGVCLPDGFHPEAWARAALAAVDTLTGVHVAMTLRFVDLAEMTGLNASFRDKPGATNVLAFPAPRMAAIADAGPMSLGDVVICLPVAVDEARSQDKHLSAHCAHLVVHGTLHLLGFDHLDEVDAVAMEGLEKEVLQRLDIADPYATERD